MTGYVLGATSLARLQGVHPSLVAVVKRAIELTTVDFLVVEGVRSKVQMQANWGKGRTVAECLAHGVPAECAQPHLAKVTWLANPLGSNHRIMPDGYGHAVDLAPLTDGVVDWKSKAGFNAIYSAMMAAAKELHVELRSGRDWDGDGILDEAGEADKPHFELKGTAA